jgi:hypothetical protein
VGVFPTAEDRLVENPAARDIARISMAGSGRLRQPLRFNRKKQQRSSSSAEDSVCGDACYAADLHAGGWWIDSTRNNRVAYKL